MRLARLEGLILFSRTSRPLFYTSFIMFQDITVLLHELNIFHVLFHSKYREEPI